MASNECDKKVVTRLIYHARCIIYRQLRTHEQASCNVRKRTNGEVSKSASGGHNTVKESQQCILLCIHPSCVRTRLGYVPSVCIYPGYVLSAPVRQRVQSRRRCTCLDAQRI